MSVTIMRLIPGVALALLAAIGETRAADDIELVPRSAAASSDGAVEWQFVREKRSGKSIPRLTKAPVVAAMKAINTDLEEEFHRLVARSTGRSSCEVTVPFANQRLFVIDWACERDPRPEIAWGSITYDLSGGHAIDWFSWADFFLPSVDKGGRIDFAQSHDIASLTLRHMASAWEASDTCLRAIFSNFDCTGTVCLGNVDWQDFLVFSPREEGLFASFRHYDTDHFQCNGHGVILPWNDVQDMARTQRPLP